MLVMSTLLLGACLGDDPVSVGGADAGSGSSSSSGSSTSSSSGSSTSSSGGSSGASSTSSSGGSSSSSGGSSSGDAGGDADVDSGVDSGPVGPPDPTCSVATLGAGAFYTTCRASAPTINAGGSFLDGNYILAGKWGCTGGNKVIGSGTIFTENGQKFLRFYRLNKVNVADATGTTTTGTLWLNGTNGTVTTNERCDGATKNTVENGTYQATATDLTILFPTHAEIWNKQ